MSFHDVLSKKRADFKEHLLPGDKLLDVDSGQKTELHAAPTVHFTMIFNSFVLMTLFNEINARKIHGQRNVLVGIFSNPIYYCIWIATFISQVRERELFI